MDNEVKFTERLWGEEVAIADQDALNKKEIAYEFSNGRKFEEPSRVAGS